MRTALLYLPCDDGMDVITKVIEVPVKRGVAINSLDCVVAPKPLIERARKITVVNEGAVEHVLKDHGR